MLRVRRVFLDSLFCTYDIIRPHDDHYLAFPNQRQAKIIGIM